MNGKEDEDNVERFEIDEEANHSTDPSKTERICAFVIILSLTFMLGVVVGQIIPSEISSSTSIPLDERNFNATSDAVSYNFLPTTRGKQVLNGLQQSLEEGGPKQFLQELSTMMDEDDQIAASCHPLAHAVGRKAFKDLGVEGAFGNMVGTPDDKVFRTCNAAYMHGVIEQFLVDAVDLKKDADYIDTNLCQNFTKSGVPSNKWECQHGIGHGVIQHYRKKKNRETLVDALATCEKTTTDTSNCQNGIWMDHFAATQLTAQLDPSLLQLCTTLPSTWACQVYAPTEYILHHPRDYAGAIKYCEEGLASNSDSCIDGVGAQSAKENMHDFLFVEAACLNTQIARQQKSCFGSGLLYYTTASGDLKIPASLCENLTVFKKQCMAMT